MLGLILGASTLFACGGDDDGGPVEPPGPDTTPPAAIIDLRSSLIRPTSLRLNWTAPGDDGEEGRAAEYDIRIATVEITPENWEDAPEVGDPPTPLSAPLNERFTVNGLLPGTRYYFVISSADESENWSGISNIHSVFTLESPDVVPPSAVDDLAVVSVADTSAVLSWTATGDDGDTGTAFAFDLRYSASPITDENFTDLIGDAIVSVPLIPGPAGTPVQFDVTVLQPATTYYFAMRVVDEGRNTSRISNNVLLTTLP
jgi:hypothetical protein